MPCEKIGVFHVRLNKFNNDSIIYQFNWNESINQKEEYRKSIYTYDSLEQLSGIEYLKWDTNISMYDTQEQLLFTYGDNYEQHIHLNWNSDSNRYLNYQNYIEYFDVKNNPTLRLYFSWNSDSLDWLIEDSTKYYYNYQTGESIEISSGWTWVSNEKVWKNNIEYERLLDEKGNILSEIKYNWNLDSEDWNNQFKSSYSYDKNDNRIEEYYQVWDTLINNWKNVEQQFYYFDDENRKLMTEKFIWDDDILNWVGVRKDSTAIDTYGHIKDYISYIWDSENSIWIKESHAKYEPIANSENDKIDRYTISIYDDDNWIKYGVEYLYYSETINDIFTCRLNQNSITLFPNPAYDKVFIESENYNLNSIEVFNMDGKVVINNINMGHNKVIDISYLGKGLYVFKIDYGVNQITSKLIIKQ